jgi:hypothetical protein
LPEFPQLTNYRFINRKVPYVPPTHTASVEILTKIGDGNTLTKEELQVIESRFKTKEEARRVCPEGIRPIFTNNAVNKYNHSTLSSEENNIISLASDVFDGCHYIQQENFVRQKLHKTSCDDTDGLPYELILVFGRPYMITNNIYVADGLSNGTVGKWKEMRTLT